MTVLCNSLTVTIEESFKRADVFRHRKSDRDEETDQEIVVVCPAKLFPVFRETAENGRVLHELELFDT